MRSHGMLLLLLISIFVSALAYQPSNKFTATQSRYSLRLRQSKPPSDDLTSTSSTTQDDTSATVFGQEFLSVKDSVRDSVYWKGKRIAVIPPSATSRQKEAERYNAVRVSFIFDSLFISMLGLCITWYFGTLIDSVSYGVGSLLGLAYANLLSKYVETVGTGVKSPGGNARFLPVILLILVYAKNKESIHIIPELVGFFSYQLGSLLQIFNEDLYKEEEKREDEK